LFLVAVATPASSIAKEVLMLKLFYSTSSAGGFFSPLAHNKKWSDPERSDHFGGA